MISLVLLGAAGRMGRAVEQAAAGSADLQIKARVDRAERLPPPGARAAGEAWSDSLESSLAKGDVVVDFSAGPATRAAARLAGARGAALVSGTTGLDPAAEAELRTASERVAVLRSANFSLGVAALRRALAATIAALPPSWDVEIVERHHRGKVDSPSGTALVLAKEAASIRGWKSDVLRFGREGRVGPRPASEIGVHAVRGGTWIGDHAVLLSGDGEWVELRHVACDRQSFAVGAVAAARFVATAPAGLYTMDDVLNPAGR
ncbi:MAG TPA: 4-hydroxy-tetrahydrodipicolinate reductase [Candidatus Eisenbacteria bacterium]